MANEVKLETKLVCDIKGDFFVPSYQRGYRWGEQEVERLLDDIYSTEGKRSYCLQPMVVRKTEENQYELIDGQQRLTTLYLIYRYMRKASRGFIDEPRFILFYETRENSKSFLESIDEDSGEEAGKNIDFWFMWQAYKSIKNWFGRRGEKEKSTLTNVNKYFDETVKVIWYEVGPAEDAIALFTRLNIGKIPLTNAELVKALFLSESANSEKNGISKERQEEIALQWDNMERELQDESLWYFLTNKTDRDYPTRIDLILDVVADNNKATRDKYATFFKFVEMQGKDNITEIWRRIQQTFLVLKDWRGNHELYHKIGYLIASDTCTLWELFSISKGKTKSAFKAALDERIKKSIEIKGNYGNLTYEKDADRKKIAKLLLLFNVESVRKKGEQVYWFPFSKHKAEGGKVSWSLEHIHAQQSEGLRTQEEWKEWLKLHIPSVEAVGGSPEETEKLVAKMEEARAKTNLSSQEFNEIREKVIALLSPRGQSEDYIHSIANLALLNTAHNAALSNSTFDVKRNAIIEMDKEGEYIPFCTRMVFLKYYTSSQNTQLHFWGQEDRKDYIKAMNEVLKDYLGQSINII